MGGRVQGGSWYVEGCWRFPYLKKSWFFGSSVSWCLVSWFISFLVRCFLASWFQRLAFRYQSFLVSKIQRLNDLMLPNVHLMFSIDIIFISKVFKNWLIISSEFSAPAFSQICRNCEIYKNNNFQNALGFLRFCWGILGFPKIQIVRFGSHGNVPKSRSHRNQGLRVPP